jgi:nucleoside-diphosphate-sugar epimerase/glycosyltransferase involved in cell wall biosynthesis/MoaA/NifB/PqqE/SkfB family radical SAM enzyme
VNADSYILVTGGAGFIGTNLVAKLSHDGYKVIILDVKLPRSPSLISNAEVELTDVRNFADVDRIFSRYRIRGVVHLAAVSRVIDAEEDHEACESINVGGLENVLKCAEAHGRPWFIFGSSREVYGECDADPAKEGAELKPVNFYGNAKLRGERMVRSYSERAGVPAIVLRFSNVYGSWFDFESRVVPRFVRNIDAGKPVQINGGDQIFDFTHISDTVDGICRAIDLLDSKSGQYYDEFHILTGDPHTLQELVAVISKVTGKKAEVEYAPARDYDVNRFTGDPGKAEKVLGFRAKVRLEEGIARTLENFRSEPMKVLKVIHGYPPYYMAGSEVYSYNLTKGLAARGYEVGVFTRTENPFVPEYSKFYSIENGVLIERVNNPATEYLFTDKYLNGNIDAAFEEFLGRFRPDIVHIGHLSHLSTNIPKICKARSLPVVMTIHDFWMFCFRGQLINVRGSICPGPSQERCTECIRSRMKQYTSESDYPNYRRQLDSAISCIDRFIAPSEHVRSFYISCGVPPEKVVHHRYGFDKSLIVPRKRHYEKDSVPNFGFLGRIIAVKGIHCMIRAFEETESDSKLLIYGDAGKYKSYLKSPDERIVLEGPYHNDDINRVLDTFDVLVAPSTWYEVSPLVIQEAFMAGIPVITSDIGGMKELVKDGVNGFTVKPNDTEGLRAVMQRIMDDPRILNGLQANGDEVVSMEEHIDRVAEIYREALHARREARVHGRPVEDNLRDQPLAVQPALHDVRHPQRLQRQEAPRGCLPATFQRYRESDYRGLRARAEGGHPQHHGGAAPVPRLREVLDLLKEKDIKLNLTTNGTFPKLGVESWAERLLPVLSDIKISMNGATAPVAEGIMTGIDFAKQKRDAARFIELRNEKGSEATVTMQATFMRSNLKELPEMVRDAVDMGFDRFKGHHVWITNERMADETLRAPGFIEQWNETVDEMRAAAGSKIKLVNVEKIVDADYVDPESVCPFLGREAWVESNGDFEVCCCPSDERAAFGKFGNVKETGFMELWDSARYRDFVSGWGDYKPCSHCNMRVRERCR